MKLIKLQIKIKYKVLACATVGSYPESEFTVSTVNTTKISYLNLKFVTRILYNLFCHISDDLIAFMVRI